MSNSQSPDGPSSSAPAAGEDAYSVKPDGYFVGARPEFISELPANAQARILEIGCGEGGMGRLAIAAGKSATYHGVELSRAAADIARLHLQEVVHGNIESMDIPWHPGKFDVLIMSEVIEHFADPASVLRRLKNLLKPGGLVLAGCPNVAHYTVILMLLRGEWRLSDSGLMDRTHLRWFTPKSLRRMFEDTGFAVEKVGLLGGRGWRGRLASVLLRGKCDWLLARQITLRAYRPK